MNTKYRVLLTILLSLSLVGALFSSSGVVSGQKGSDYQVFLPLVSKITHPSYYSTTWYVTKDLFDFTGGKRNIYYKGVQAGNLTAAEGRQDQLIILHFGRPRTDGIQVGTRAYFDDSGDLTSTGDIYVYAQDFINGFMAGALANNDYESKLDLGVGTSNLNWEYYVSRTCEGYFCTVDEAFNHGKAWAEMIDKINDWVIAQGFAHRVSVAGASDIELSWNSAKISHAWVDGFDKNDDEKYIFYNFGTCDGCDVGINLTKDPDPNKDLSDDWTHAKVHYSAWGADPVWPIPEIYLNNGWNANQWANISKVGVMLGYYPIYFYSALTQYQACDGANDPVCPYTDNTPVEGWTQLMQAINARPETAQDFIPFMTDIDWP